jgi:NADH:ubiquinone oxidoreductase subunit
MDNNACRDQPRVGKLVGTDEFGNEYYENREDISSIPILYCIIMEWVANSIIDSERSVGHLQKVGF